MGEAEEVDALWTAADQVDAGAQGWGLFAAAIHGFSIGVVEFNPVLRDDDEALALVARRAAAGEPLALKALRFAEAAIP